MQSPVYFILLLIIKVHGDDKIEYPKFPRQAEFILENLINDGQHQRIRFQCYYDYNQNHLIVINEQNYEYHNYARLTTAIYSFKQCQMYSIERDNSLDGFSAMTNIFDQTTHIRPLEDFFLLTSNATYLGESFLRGFIHVQQWKTIITNDSEIIWSFAQSNYTMPWKINNYSIPIQRIIRRKDDGLILQVLNIFDYKPMIIKNDLTPPKGIFCVDLVPKYELISLQDLGFIFPEKFRISIDITTSLQRFWHVVHLQYYATKQRRLLRYDYTLEEHIFDPMTIIFDLSEDFLRSYQINRRTGTCLISNLTEIILIRSVLHNPIETLIKYEDFLLTNPKKQFFQYSGEQQCRGSILCQIYIGQISQFPSDPEIDWSITNIEWAWSKQSEFNYPISLDLHLYESQNSFPSYIHYEFYDYHTNVDLNEFDVNLCYRSNQLQYQHLVFQVRIIKASSMNSSESIGFFRHSRRQLTESIHQHMINLMNIDYLRISKLQLDYQFNEVNYNQTIFCMFTLLDRTPFVEINSQIGLIDARTKLEYGINAGLFQFYTEYGFLIEAISNSLNIVEYFDQFNPNDQTSMIMNGTILDKIEIIHEKFEYSYQIQLITIISGILFGIFFGILFIIIIISIMKRKINRANANNFAFENISFHIGTHGKDDERAIVTMEHPVHVSDNIHN